MVAPFLNPPKVAPTWGEPGLHLNVPFHRYAALDAVSKTLMGYLAETPADARLWLDEGGDATEELVFGQGAHCALLEPERFDTEYAVGPDVDLSTKIGKAEWGKFTAANIGKKFIRGAAGAKLPAMRARLFEHPEIRELLHAEGVEECSVVMRDPKTGLLLKCRPDRLIWWRGQLCLIDYKTTVSASRTGFPRSYAKFRYFLQEAFYRDIVGQVVGPVAHFFFIAQEKEPPFKANVFCFPDDRVEQGRKMYRDLVDLYDHCRQTDSWTAAGRDYVPEIIRVKSEDVSNYSMNEAL